jgi:hypothetical protein
VESNVVRRCDCSLNQRQNKLAQVRQLRELTLSVNESSVESLLRAFVRVVE